MDWQTLIALTIAFLAALYAARSILWPWIREFIQKKPADAGCGSCGCGIKASPCQTHEKEQHPS